MTARREGGEGQTGKDAMQIRIIRERAADGPEDVKEEKMQLDKLKALLY